MIFFPYLRYLSGIERMFLAEKSYLKSRSRFKKRKEGISPTRKETVYDTVILTTTTKLNKGGAKRLI